MPSGPSFSADLPFHQSGLVSTGDPGEISSAPEGMVAESAGADAVPFARLVMMASVVSFVVAIPSIFLYYAGPFIAMLWFISSPRVFARISIWTACFGLLAATALGLDALMGLRTNPGAVLVGFLTYSPWLMAFALRQVFEGPVSDVAWRGFLRLVAIFVLLQSCVASVEFAIFQQPDLVTGTFGLINSMKGVITVSQVYFCFNMIGCTLLLACYPSSWLNRAAILAGSGTFLLAQSGHQTFFVLAAIPTVMFVSYRRLGLALKGLLIFAVGAVALHLLYPQVWQVGSDWWYKVVVNERSLKRHMVYEALDALSSPKNAVFGTGVGQFSSKAAVLSADTESSIPDKLRGRSEYYRTGVEIELPAFEEEGEGSAISKPYFSAMSVVVEFGCLATLFLLIWLGKIYIGNDRRARRGGEGGRLAAATNIGLLTLLLCCSIENYLEFVQGLTIPVLLVLFARRRISHLDAQEPAPEEAA